jgi:hypothetical protein
MEEFGLTTNVSMTTTEIEDRFGYHRHTTRTAPVYAKIRNHYIEFAKFLDETLPAGWAKSVAFTELETSMAFALKAIEKTDPLVYQYL